MKPYLILILMWISLADTAQPLGRIDSLVNLASQKPHEPGFSVMIWRHDSLIYSRQLGMANVKRRQPISENTIFNIGSVTKQFTAFCILKLEQEGKLKRSDSVQQYLPELPIWDHPITIENLLGHTSGLPDYLEVYDFLGAYSRGNVNRERLFSYYQTKPTLSFAPGSRFSYSNAGYMMLAMIVERVAKMPIADYMRLQIFEPLGMNTASCVFNEEDGLQGTRSYAALGKRYHYRSPTLPNAIGATGVCCSLKDFRKWDRNFLYPTIATRAIVEEMRRCYYLRDGSKIGYGSGILITPYFGFVSEEHSGGWNNFLVQFRRIPEQELSIMIAGNREDYHPFQLCDAITQLLLNVGKSDRTFFEGKACMPFPPDVDGTYLDENNVLRKIWLKDGTPVLTTFQDTTKIKQRLCILENNEISVRAIDDSGDTLNFEKRGGKIYGMYYTGSTYFRFLRHYQKMSCPVTFENFGGTFRHEFYRVRLRITGSQDQAVLHYRGNQSTLLTLGGGIYKLPNSPVIVRFEGDTLWLGNDWFSNLKFVLQR